MPAFAAAFVDQRGRRDEPRLEAVLDRAVGDADGDVRLPPPGLAREDEVPALGDELRAEVGPELLAAQGRLEDEVELLNGLEVGKVGVTRELLDAGVGTVRDLLGEEEREKVPETQEVTGGSEPAILSGLGAVRLPDATGRIVPRPWPEPGSRPNPRQRPRGVIAHGDVRGASAWRGVVRGVHTPAR